MYSLSDIKHRIKGITETRQITSAMETISVAKMRKALAKYEANQQYFTKIREAIKDIIVHSKNVTHKYLQKREGDRAVYIVIASDKGLAGGYNHNVLTMAWDSIKDRENKFIFTVGQVANEFFEFKKIAVDGEFTHFTHDPTAVDATNIVDSILNLYDLDLLDEAYIIYTGMPSRGIVKPNMLKLLPLIESELVGEMPPEDITENEDAETKRYFRELTYDPSPDEVLKELVPQYLVGVVYGALVQSVASEHSSRRLAMSNATKNANKIIEKLNVFYNRARQEGITNELLEICSADRNG